MSASVGAIRKVKGIIPVELQNMADEGRLDYDKVFASAIAQKDKEFEESDFVAPVDRAAERKARKAEREQQRQEKAYKKIRDQMIKNAFGVTSKKLQTYEKEINDFKSGTSKPAMTQAEATDNLRNVWRGQLGSNKRAIKDLGEDAVKNGWKIALLLATGKVAEVLLEWSAYTAIATVASSILVLGLVYKGYKTFKARKGNVADGYEKQTSYIQSAEALMGDVSSFGAQIDMDRELLMSKKKSMSKKDFEAWAKSYASIKLEDMDLEPDKDLFARDEFKEHLKDSGDNKKQVAEQMGGV